MKRPDKRQEVKQKVVNVCYYLVGSLLYAVSVNCFSAPNQIAPGGVTGVATMIHYVVPAAPIGLTIFVLNIPLLVAAGYHLGRTFTIRTVGCIVLSAAIMDVSAPLLPVYQGDTFLVSVMGGTLSGAGLGLIFLRGGSTGGTEVVARLLERRFPYLSVGQLMLAVDALVIGLSAFVFKKPESAMYAVVLTFVSSRLIDTLVYGTSGGKLALIVSKQHQEIATILMSTLKRGVTKLHSRGGYAQEEGEVLVCAVARTQVYTLRQLVARTDPTAFVVMVSAEEVLGKGFARLGVKKN